MNEVDLSKRIDDPRADMTQKLTTLMWIVSAWSIFLTALLAVFGFLRR